MVGDVEMIGVQVLNDRIEDNLRNTLYPNEPIEMITLFFKSLCSFFEASPCIKHGPEIFTPRFEYDLSPFSIVFAINEKHDIIKLIKIFAYCHLLQIFCST